MNLRKEKELNFPLTQGEKAKLLFFACKEGNLNLCKLAVNLGANVNSLDGNNRPPLFYAVSNFQIFKFLEEKGADIFWNDGGYTLFHHAVMEGNCELADYLRKKGFSEHESGCETCFPPIFYTLFNNDIDTLKCLVEKGWDFSVRENNLSLLDWAIDMGYLNTAKFLIEIGILEYYSEVEKADLLATFLENDIEELVDILILEEKVKPNILTSKGIYPVFYSSNPNMTKALLKEIEYPHLEKHLKRKGGFLLFLAFQNKNRYLIEFLLKRGVSLNRLNRSKLLTLYKQIYLNLDIKLLKLFIDYRLNLYLKDEKNKNLLYHLLRKQSLTKQQDWILSTMIDLLSKHTNLKKFLNDEFFDEFDRAFNLTFLTSVLNNPYIGLEHIMTLLKWVKQYPEIWAEESLKPIRIQTCITHEEENN